MEIAGQIIIGVIFLAIIGHIVYEIFIKPKLKIYSVDDFIQTRVAEGKPEYATEDENEEALGLLEEVYNGWRVVNSSAENETRAPLKGKQVKNSVTLLKAVATIAPTDEEVVDRLNELSEVVNTANKRSFNGSKTLIIASIIVFVIISLISGTWAGAVFFIGSIIFYALASFTPTFVLHRKEINGSGGNRSFMTAIIGGLFGTIAGARTVKTINRDTGEVVDVDNSETWISMLFTFLVLVALACFIAIFGFINYLRNFWWNI